MKTYAIVNIETGLVDNTMLWDGVEKWEAPAGFDAIASDEAGIGWSYVGGVFIEPQPTPTPAKTSAELTAASIAARDALLVQASLAIAPLQYAVDLDDATKVELEKLNKWKKYSIALNRIQDQDGFPFDIDWPVSPE